MTTAAALISQLPPPKWNEKIISDEQSVHDIVSEVLTAHQVFSKDYDLICDNFAGGNAPQKVFDFCRANLDYVVEGEDDQTTRSPAVLLSMGHCDCKGYAGFVAGVLDGLNRSGQGAYDWRYRFAKYGKENHVFVVLKNPDGSDTWIDPVLSDLDQRFPAPDSWVDKGRPMTLVRMSGQLPPRPNPAFSVARHITSGGGLVAGPLSGYGCCGCEGVGQIVSTFDPPADLQLPGPVPAGTTNAYGTATWIPAGFPTKTQPYLVKMPPGSTPKYPAIWTGNQASGWSRLILRPLPVAENVQAVMPYILAALQVGISQYSPTPYSILYVNQLGSAPARISMATSQWAPEGVDNWLLPPPVPSGLDKFQFAASSYILTAVSAGLNALVPGLGTIVSNALNAETGVKPGQVTPAFVSVANATNAFLNRPGLLQQTAAPPAGATAVTSGSGLFDTVVAFAQANPLIAAAVLAGGVLLITKIAD